MNGRDQANDLIVVGAGAAGLAAAIFAARHAPALRVRCLEGAKSIGAKILVSGGSRCNVTNRVVTERDYWGGSSRIVRRVLQAFPAQRAVAFFESLGVELQEEEDGKLFPRTNRSRTVLDALLREAARCHVTIDVRQRVTAIRSAAGGFEVVTASGAIFHARAVVIATGGKSLPKTGSDGVGYELAARFGHGHVPDTPALAPLLVEGDRPLSGVAHPATLSLRTNGGMARRLEGSMLWTHFGLSGPVALNMSRHWHRAVVEGAEPEVLLNLLPGETFESVEAWLLEQERQRPRARVATVLASRVPAAVAEAWVESAGIAPDETMAHVTRDCRRRLVHLLVESVLPVIGSRGYGYAEVTAGGVPLEEIDPATMESRLQRGLYFAGEILDVDGRLGGFNFQWAWASGYVAGRAIARVLA